MELTDLRETAALARLNLSGEELENIFPAFEEMVSFFAVMQGADAAGAFPRDMPAAPAQIVTTGYLRPDTEQAPPDGTAFEAMLSQAPERDGRFIVIPNVL